MSGNSVIETNDGPPNVKVGSISTSAVTLLAKLEGLNPSGSVKDRCALGLVRAAQQRSSLEGKVLLDASSGNLGSAIAMIGASLGVRVRLLVSNTITHEKRRTMELYGAELQFVQG